MSNSTSIQYATNVLGVRNLRELDDRWSHSAGGIVIGVRFSPRTAWISGLLGTLLHLQRRNPILVPAYFKEVFDYRPWHQEIAVSAFPVWLPIPLTIEAFRACFCIRMESMQLSSLASGIFTVPEHAAILSPRLIPSLGNGLVIEGAKSQRDLNGVGKAAPVPSGPEEGV